jgi:glycosyltransferase involved in cell wall biosynthesis
MNDRLTELIQELELEKYVILVGNLERRDIPAFLSGLDIYVQSSVSEGSPLTIKEAMASVLPVVSTDVGGIPEMIIDGETGILVPHDDQGEFTRALNEIVNMDAVKREKMGKNAHSYAMKYFSMETLAQKNYTIYKRLIKYNR